MLTPQFLLPIASEIVVDLFAGGGGASCGIEQALGRHVDVAVNHDPEAVSLHQANHPQTEHYCEDVFAVDPRRATGGRPVGLLWASPDCKHFSKAKGGKPVSKKIRGLAWVVVKWAKAVRPRVICLENVEEFQTWGPVLENGMPCPDRKGLTFRRWVGQLRALGYVVEWRELRACDYGAPTIRKRLFLVARRDGAPIVWPAPTHGPGLKPYRTAAECIDWSLPCPSIFERERPLAEATLRRIAHGVMRYVVNAAKPFIVPVTHHGDVRVHGIGEPLRTVTSAKRGEFALVSPTLVEVGYGEREGQAPRAPGLHKPLGTVVGARKHALVAAFMAKHFGGDPEAGKTAQDMRKPAPTVLARGGPQAVVFTALESLNGGAGCAEGADRPRADATAARRDDLEAGASRQPAAGEVDRSEASGKSVQERVPDGEDGVDGADVFAGRSRRRVQVAERAAAAWHGGQPRGRRQDEQPAGQPRTDDAGAKPRSRASDRSEECARGESQGVGHAKEVRALLTTYYGTDQDPVLRQPLHTVTTKDRFGLVMVEGEPYEITDIGMRMLQPRELFRANGFPESYRIDRGHDGKPLSKAAQVRMCGNSVAPKVARALVLANYADAAIREAA